MPASPARVAARFLALTQVPRVVRRKDEAQALVDSLSPIELEIIHHLWSGGTVAHSTGNDHVTLSPPMRSTWKTKKPTKADYKHLPGGFAAVTRLARAGWVRKAAQNMEETFFYWWLTDDAQKVFRLVEPKRTAAVGVPQDLREVWDEALARAASGLNFSDEEDRVTFRGMVFDRTKNAMVTLLRELAAALGKPVSGSASRVEAARAIADAWMKGKRLL